MNGLILGVLRLNVEGDRRGWKDRFGNSKDWQ